MTRSTALTLLIGKAIFGATLALGFFTSPAGNAAPQIAAMDSRAFASAEECAAHSHVHRCAGAIKGVCVR